MNPTQGRISLMCGNRQLVSVLFIVLMDCGGNSQDDTSSTTTNYGGSPQGGFASQSGGNDGVEGGVNGSTTLPIIQVGGTNGEVGGSSSGGETGSGTTPVATGGVTVQGAGGSQSGSCGESTLWTALTRSATGGLGVCVVLQQDNGAPVSRLRGALILDANGKVTDNTGLSGTEKQTWLDSLANQSWPCLAAQTIQYSCTVGG